MGVKAKFLTITLVIALGTTSCSYVAGEAASNAVETGSVAGTSSRSLSSTVTGHLGTNLVLGIVGGWLVAKRDAANIRKLAYDCLVNNPEKGKECLRESEERWKIDSDYFLAKNAGKCTKSFLGLNPFASFRTCWNEGFEVLEKYAKEKELPFDDLLYQVYWDSFYVKCMPDPASLKSEEKAYALYTKCSEEAHLKTREKLEKEVRPKLQEYLKKKETSSRS